MCRYSISQYKPHYTCFNCRKTFKQHRLNDFLKEDGKLDFYKALILKPIKQLTQIENDFLNRIERSYTSRKIKCPECGQQMVDLGLDFKTPPKSNIKKWKIAEGMFKTGKRFYGCGCYETGVVPVNMQTFKAYLTDVLKQYRQALADSQQMTLKEYPNKLAAVKHWEERISQVEKELMKLKAKNV